MMGNPGDIGKAIVTAIVFFAIIAGLIGFAIGSWVF